MSNINNETYWLIRGARKILKVIFHEFLELCSTAYVLWLQDYSIEQILEKSDFYIQYIYYINYITEYMANLIILVSH